MCSQLQLEALTNPDKSKIFDVNHSRQVDCSYEAVTPVVWRDASHHKWPEHHCVSLHLLQATKHLADMAGNMPCLKAFVHVSTAYVNGNQPKGSIVPEQLIPLQDEQGQAVDHSALVTSLQLMPREEASMQVMLFWPSVSRAPLLGSPDMWRK